MVKTKHEVEKFDDLPEAVKPAAPSGAMKTIEEWAAELKVDPAIFAVAKAITPGWGVGRECTKDVFTSALHRAANLTFR